MKRKDALVGIGLLVVGCSRGGTTAPPSAQPSPTTSPSALVIAGVAVD